MAITYAAFTRFVGSTESFEEEHGRMFAATRKKVGPVPKLTKEVTGGALGPVRHSQELFAVRAERDGLALKLKGMQAELKRHKFESEGSADDQDSVMMQRAIQASQRREKKVCFPVYYSNTVFACLNFVSTTVCPLN